MADTQKTMKVSELTMLRETPRFFIGKSKVIWESAGYPNNASGNWVVISRIVDAGQGGRPFMLGLNYKKRFVDPDTVVNIIEEE